MELGDLAEHQEEVLVACSEGVPEGAPGEHPGEVPGEHLGEAPGEHLGEAPEVVPGACLMEVLLGEVHPGAVHPDAVHHVVHPVV